MYLLLLSDHWLWCFTLFYIAPNDWTNCRDSASNHWNWHWSWQSVACTLSWSTTPGVFLISKVTCNEVILLRMSLFKICYGKTECFEVQHEWFFSFLFTFLMKLFKPISSSSRIWINFKICMSGCKSYRSCRWMPWQHANSESICHGGFGGDPLCKGGWQIKTAEWGSRPRHWSLSGMRTKMKIKLPRVSEIKKQEKITFAGKITFACLY